MNNKFFGSLLLLLLLFPVFFPGSLTGSWSQENDLTEEQTLETIFTEVVAHLEFRDYFSALEVFDKLPPEYIENTEIRILRASIYNAASLPANARRIANEIIALENNNTDALMILADAAALENRDRDRRTFLERVISINPNHTRALNDLANISLGNQNLRAAANYFDRALAAEPDNGEALVGRAAVHRFNRELRDAERVLNYTVNLYPDWGRPLQERARLYRGAGFLSDALEDFSAALALEPDNYWILVDYAQTLMDVNRKPEAIEFLDRAIEIAPDVFFAYALRAGIRDGLADYAGAEQDYLILTRLRPDYYFGFEALGILRMRNQRWAPARDAFLDAYRQAPAEYSYAILAAINWMRAGRQTDPRQFLAQVMRTAPRDSLDHAMLRLFHDLSGDADITIRIQNETNIFERSRMLFYLASYYDIRGNRQLADRFYLMVQDIDAAGTLEWRLNEMILTERGLNLRTAE